MPLTAKSKLPEDVVNHVAKFLPGNISVSMLLNKLEHFFNVTLNNTTDFSDEFLQKHSKVNQRIQHKYDKKYGLSLWECKDIHRKQFHKNKQRRNTCEIL